MKLLSKLDLDKLKNYPHILDILLGLILKDIGTEDFFIKIEKKEVFAITNHKSFLLPSFFTVEDILNNLNYSKINKTTQYTVKKDIVLNVDLIYRVAIHQSTEEEYTIALRCVHSPAYDLKKTIKFSDNFLSKYHYLNNKLENNLDKKSTINNKFNKI
jgi:hypothetical protein